MKKVFLLFMILGLTSISIIDINGFTFNGSYNFNDINLDTPLSELNGASLNEIFDYDYLETLPLIEYQGYRNGYDLDINNDITFYEYVYIDLGYKNIFDPIQNITYGKQLTPTDVLNNNVNVNVSDYIRVFPNTTYYNNNSIGGVSLGVNFYDENKNLIGWQSQPSLYGDDFTTISNTYYIRINLLSENYPGNNWNTTQIELGSTGTTYVPFGQLSEVYRLYTTPIENVDLVQSLYFYNLENIPINTIKYYFAVFLLHKYNLPVDDLWNQAFNAGNAQGYDTGYDFGLTDGFLQGETYGYNQGYNAGVTEEIDTQYLLGFVEGTVNILGVSIIPGITLGVFVFIPLFLGFIGFIFRLGGRRG